MKTNKLNLSLFLIVLTVFTIMNSVMVSAIGATEYAGLASDNLTIEKPAASATIQNETWTIACSFDQTIFAGAKNFTYANWTESRVYMRSASTAQTGGVLLTTLANDTVMNFSGTIAASKIEDSNDVVITFVFRNGTSEVNISRTGLIVDSTIPTAATSRFPSSGATEPDGTFVFAVTVTENRTTGCTLLFDGINPGSNSYTMTHSGANCSYSATALPEGASYQWYVRASDGTNTTDSGNQIVNVDVQEGGGYNPPDEQPPALGEIAKSPIGIIIIVAIIFVIGMIIKNRRK